jgi:hypothetical protein
MVVIRGETAATKWEVRTSHAPQERRRQETPGGLPDDPFLA